MTKTRTLRKLTAALACGLLAAACALPDDPDQNKCSSSSDCLDDHICVNGTCIESIPADRQAFSRLMADAACGKLDACCGMSEDLFALCRAGVKLDVESWLPPGSAITNLEDARTCLEGISLLQCDEPQDELGLHDLPVASTHAPACRRLFAGSLQAGQPCAPEPTSGPHCQQGCTCTEDEAGAWTCVELRQAGESCFLGEWGETLCDEAHQCDYEGDRLCHPKKALGETCQDDWECLSARCEASVCVSWTWSGFCADMIEEPGTDRDTLCTNVAHLACTRMFLCLDTDVVTRRMDACNPDVVGDPLSMCMGATYDLCMEDATLEMSEIKQCGFDLADGACSDFGGFEQLAADFPESCANMQAFVDGLCLHECSQNADCDTDAGEYCDLTVHRCAAP